jgi:hypothetical protein
MHEKYGVGNNRLGPYCIPVLLDGPWMNRTAISLMVSPNSRTIGYI